MGSCYVGTNTAVGVVKPHVMKVNTAAGFKRLVHRKTATD